MGINLSGGQKARICLARAVYADCDIMLMDDPISALDANVRKLIFSDVFQSLCKNKTRVLVTHAIDFIHVCDKIVIMEKGQIQAVGTNAELSSNVLLQKIVNAYSSQRPLNQLNTPVSEKLAPNKL